jgi:tRNA threonylcarbamoyladenosine biosynthesis protein TsaB
LAYILLIDTSTPICSVALSNGGQILAEQNLSGQQHAAQLTLSISEVLATAEIDWPALQAVAVCKGPGSYTGLRIGVATAKAICFARNLPLIAIDSLLPTAFMLRKLQQKEANKAKKYLYLPLIDARRQDAYCGLYDENLQLLELIDCREPTAEWLAPYADYTIIWGGDAVPKYKNQPWAARCSSPTNEPLQNAAAHFGELAEQDFINQNFENIYSFEPFYLKPPMITQPKNVSFIEKFIEKFI